MFLLLLNAFQAYLDKYALPLIILYWRIFLVRKITSHVRPTFSAVKKRHVFHASLIIVD